MRAAGALPIAPNEPTGTCKMSTHAISQSCAVRRRFLYLFCSGRQVFLGPGYLGQDVFGASRLDEQLKVDVVTGRVQVPLGIAISMY